MLDIAFMKGRAARYRHFAKGTENKESAEALIAVAVAFEAEAELIEEQLDAWSPSSEGR